MMIVTKNIVVIFRYIMKNNKGEVLENTMEGSPKCYLHGSAGIHPSLQVQFEGLKVGDTKIIYLKNEHNKIICLCVSFMFDCIFRVVVYWSFSA